MSDPPLYTVVPTASPLLDTSRLPPWDTMVPLAMPELVNRLTTPPLDTMVPNAMPPKSTSSVTPLLTT